MPKPGGFKIHGLKPTPTDSSRLISADNASFNLNRQVFNCARGLNHGFGCSPDLIHLSPPFINSNSIIINHKGVIMGFNSYKPALIVTTFL